MRQLTNEQINKIFDLLIEHCGAHEDERADLVRYFTDVQDSFLEFRFCGNLGWGGKIKNNSGGIYVCCYPEDATPERDKMIQEMNWAINDLLQEDCNDWGFKPNA